MNFSRVLRRIILGGVFLIPVIPFIVSSELFFPFITGKNFAFRILTEILFASWLLLALRDVSFRPSFSWILTTIVAFVGIIALADIFGAYPEKSIWSNFERMEGLVTLIHLLLYFIVARRNGSKYRKIVGEILQYKCHSKRSHGFVWFLTTCRSVYH